VLVGLDRGARVRVLVEHARVVRSPHLSFEQRMSERCQLRVHHRGRSAVVLTVEVMRVRRAAAARTAEKTGAEVRRSDMVANGDGRCNGGGGGREARWLSDVGKPVESRE
jgi:hypothetical protein